MLYVYKYEYVYFSIIWIQTFVLLQILWQGVVFYFECAY